MCLLIDSLEKFNKLNKRQLSRYYFIVTFLFIFILQSCVTQEEYLKQFLTGSKRGEKKQAFLRLDKEHTKKLLRIANDNNSLLWAIKFRLGEISWKDILDYYKAYNPYCEYTMDDVIGVVEYISMPEEISLRNKFISMCHEYARTNNITKVMALKNILWETGYMSLAEIYLNSDNDELRREAEEWARYYNYRISREK